MTGREKVAVLLIWALVALAAIPIILVIGLATSKPNYTFSIGGRHLYLFLEPAVGPTAIPTATVPTCPGCTTPIPIDTPYPTIAITPGAPFLEVEGPLRAVCVVNVPAYSYPSMFKQVETSATPTPPIVTPVSFPPTPINIEPVGLPAIRHTPATIQDVRAYLLQKASAFRRSMGFTGAGLTIKKLLANRLPIPMRDSFSPNHLVILASFAADFYAPGSPAMSEPTPRLRHGYLVFDAATGNLLSDGGSP